MRAETEVVRMQGKNSKHTSNDPEGRAEPRQVPLPSLLFR